MSTLLVTLDFPPAFTGGVASWAEDLAGALHRAGEPVTVLARATGDTAASDRARPYPVRRMPGRSWARHQGLWALLSGLPRLGAGRDLRVIFATWPLASLLGPAAAAAGASVGVAFHGSDLTRLPAPSPAFRRAIGAATALLPVSGFLASELGRLGAPTERARVLPMPLPLPDAPGPRGEALLCVARLTPLKGVERAIGLARRMGRPLVVVGEGPELARLRAAAEGTATTFLGRLSREDIQGIPAAAALLLPRADADGSGAEGLGLTLIEAAARGLPAIGCDTGGVREAVGVGLVIARPDDPDAADLSAAAALLVDPSAGARARAWAAATHGPEACLTALDRALPVPGGA